MTPNKSIRRTLIQYGAIFGFLYFFLIFLSHEYVIWQLSDETRKHRLSKELESFQSIIQNESPEDDELRGMIDRFQLLLEHAVIIEMKNGDIIASGNLDKAKLTSVLEKPSGFIYISQDRENLLGLKRVTEQGNELVSITILELEEALTERSLGAHLTLLAASAILLLVLLTLVGAATYRALKPVGEIREDLRRLQSGKKSHLNSDVPEEFKSLIKQFNNAIELASRRLDRHRRLNSDLSHMVKTSISANLAVLTAGDSSPLSLEDEAFMVSNLRELSQALNYRMSKADIAGKQMGQACLPVEIADNVINVMQKIFPDKMFNMHTLLPKDFSWPMERQDLSEMLGNVLENSGKWCHKQVDILIAQAGSALIIDISDDGPGIAQNEASKVLDRGSRLDETITGFGLGLAIVAEIIEDNFGQMEIGTSTTGGARIVVTLPMTE
ncbi:sensor histidine kinase [Marinobacter fonticola]|uniref:sensor histidine kinase n=1 Tax=Marinobacter fonticola TaxID=2603215 RepID=UPI0011E76B69|nr:ATP-binding protein [Marinobacter fonticola]